MRYLLMGYGSIARALMAIIKDRGEVYDITICDMDKDGIRGQDLIERDHNRFDAVINLTNERVRPIIDLCDRYHLRYLDAGYEDENSVFVDRYLSITEEKPDTAHLYGFGMNPGIVELMPFLQNPGRPYYALVLETDLPERADGAEGGPYATWCPASYYDEAAVLDAFISTKEETCRSISDERRYGIRIESIDGSYDYNVTPHEEIFNIRRRDPLCLGSAFIYHAPEKLQRHVIENRGKGDGKFISSIPVLHDLKGSESVGILLYDGSDNVSYVMNRSSHSDCFRRFGYNATCWQTACGVYVGLRLLEQVPDGSSMTFTDACRLYLNEIRDLLHSLDFQIEIIDHYMTKEEFEKKLLPLFS